jgi:hypothetical protein
MLVAGRQQCGESCSVRDVITHLLFLTVVAAGVLCGVHTPSDFPHDCSFGIYRRRCGGVKTTIGAGVSS